MTQRDQAAHLLRRFGFGATPEELDRLQLLSLDDAIKDVTNFAKPDNAYPVSPYEFYFLADGRSAIQTPRLALWWFGRMLMTDRPIRDKLLLFLHDHFAVSSEKVTSGLLMLYYFQTLDRYHTAPFAQLLQALTVDPAMMQWLDLHISVKGAANENYARELLELFTLGIGNYSEADVKEASRALTGWSLRNVFNERGRSEELYKTFAQSGEMLVVPSYAPHLRDPGPHTILGEKKSFDVASLCKSLSEKPQTARYLSQKLWEFFAYPEPEPKIVEKLADTYLKNEGRLTAVVQMIPRLSEFWSPKAMRAIVKDPVDFVVPVFRQIVPKPAVLRQRKPNATPITAIPNPVISLTNSMASVSRKLGLLPFYPPDVAGWDWGHAWISSTTMMDRIQLGVLLTGPYGGTVAARVLGLAKKQNIVSNEQLVRLIVILFDAQIADDQFKLLADAANQSKLMENQANVAAFSKALQPVLKLLFGTPQFQLM